LLEEVALRFHELISSVSQEQLWEIIQVNLSPDHVYLYLGATPNVSPAEVMVKIKGWTSRILREEFHHLSHLPSLWTRSFFVSTEEAVPNRLIQDYISQQKKRG
jgi:putative transposase